MKKWFAFGAIFLSAYLVFLVATLPINFVVNKIPLPKNISISGLSGTLWQGSIEQLVITHSRKKHTEVQKINFNVSFWSLLLLELKITLQFGDSFLSGPEGELTVSVNQERVTLTNVEVLISANDIAQQLTLPLPISAQGDVSISLNEVSFKQISPTQCIEASGNAKWSKTGVVALDKNIKLGDLSAEIVCQDNTFTAKISPKNNLGLTFSAYVQPKGRFSGDGYLKPGVKFPAQLRAVLPFLGKKDSKDRYRLSF